MICQQLTTYLLDTEEARGPRDESRMAGMVGKGTFRGSQGSMISKEEFKYFND